MTKNDIRYSFRLRREAFANFLGLYGLSQKEVLPSSRKKLRGFDDLEALDLVESFNNRNRAGVPFVTPCDLFELNAGAGQLNLERLQSICYMKIQERFENHSYHVPIAVLHSGRPTSDHEEAIEFGIQKALEFWSLTRRWTQPVVRWFPVHESKASELWRQLAEDDFLCVIGPFLTETVRWVLRTPGWKHAGLPMLVPGATADELVSEGSQLLFRPCSGDDRKLTQLIEWILADFNAETRPIVLFSDCAGRRDGYSGSTLKNCIDVMRRRNLGWVEATFDRTKEGDGIAVLRRKIETLGHPCLVLCLGFADGYRPGAKWALDQKHDVFAIDPRVATIESPTMGAIAAGGKALDGFRAIGDRLFANRAPGNLMNLRWLKRQYDADPSMSGKRRLSEAAIGFDAVVLTLQRISEYSGFLRHGASKSDRRATLCRALRSTRPLEDTIYGNGVFNERNEIETPISRYVVRDGKCTTDPEPVV